MACNCRKNVNKPQRVITKPAVKNNTPKRLIKVVNKLNKTQY